MNSNTNKQARVQRLRSIEENRMTALAVEFAQAQAKLIELQEHAAKLQSEIASNPLSRSQRSGSNHNIAAHVQSLAWLSSLEQQLLTANEMTTQHEAACDTIRQQMVAQKVKVNGWEKLTQKMKSEADTEEEATASMEADDRFLSRSASR